MPHRAAAGAYEIPKVGASRKMPLYVITSNQRRPMAKLVDYGT